MDRKTITKPDYIQTISAKCISLSRRLRPPSSLKRNVNYPYDDDVSVRDDFGAKRYPDDGGLLLASKNLRSTRQCVRVGIVFSLSALVL